MTSSRLYKRQCNAQSDQDAKRQRFEENGHVKGSREIDAVLGDQDYFSTLPDDCLFSVLSYLDRGSLDTMQGVNQKMYFITHHKGCRKTKEEVDHITIARSCYGGLHDVMMEKLSGEVFAYRESRTVSDGVKGKARSEEDLANDSSYNSDDEYGPPDDQQDIIRNVPESVFQAIEELLIKHDPRSLYLINILIDKSLIERLKTAVNHRFPELIGLDDIKIGKGVRFDQFIFGTQSCRLSITHFEQLAVFEEDFFREFGRLCQNRQKGAEFDVWNRSGQQNTRWTPARETLRYFPAYSSLVLYAITLTVELLIDLIQLSFSEEGCLRSKPSHKRWIFSMNTRPNKAHFRQLEVANFLVTESCNRVWPSFTIEKQNYKQRFTVHHGNMWDGFPTIEMYFNSYSSSSNR